MATAARRKRRSSYDLTPRWLSLRRIVGVLLLGIVVVGGIYGTRVVMALSHLTGESPVAVVGDLVSGGHNSSAVSQKVGSLNRINIAVYGYGGPGHDGPYLTDSIMIVSIQPEASGPPKVAEISIPRDWYVPIHLADGETTYQRINDAYALGMGGSGPEPANTPGAGAALADATLENLLGIHIDYYVGVDFSAFKAGVDAVGGVDVNVKNTFTDYQYPAGECGDFAGANCGYMTVHFNAGMQHMNGTQALEFTRSRHSLNNGEGTDFARSQRQQLVIAALKTKVESVGGIGKIPDLLNALGDHVTTNLKVSDMESLYGLVKDVDTTTVIHASLDDTNFLYECGYPNNCGASYLFAHDRSYASIQNYVKNIFVSEPALNEKISVTIVDASGYHGLASARWVSLMNKIGLTTTDGGSAPTQTDTQVIDNSGGSGAATAQWLASYFGVSVETPSPSPSASGVASSASSPATASGGGITVILGRGEEQSFNNRSGNGY